MKVLYINGFFKLPDNFEGEFADALRVLADYHEDSKRPAIEDVPDVMPSTERTYVEAWKVFLEFVKKSKGRLFAVVSLSQVNDDGSTKDLDTFGK